MSRGCRHCGRELATSRAWFCSSRCRKRAFRRRLRGVPEDAFPAGAGRGRVRLDEPTRRERAAAIATAREV